MTLLAAASEALYWEHVLTKTGDSIMSAILGDVRQVEAWQHYPDPDAYDPDSGSQFYYHSHGSDLPEHGHFHCFLRPDGLDGPLYHLIALAVDPAGRPARLFTVNGWVTGADWLDAAGTIALLPRFDLQINRPAWPACRWLTALLTLYRPEITALLVKRDQGLDPAALEDRSRSTLSECAIHLPERWRELQASNP